MSIWVSLHTAEENEMMSSNEFQNTQAILLSTIHINVLKLQPYSKMEYSKSK